MYMYRRQLLLRAWPMDTIVPYIFSSIQVLCMRLGSQVWVKLLLSNTTMAIKGEKKNTSLSVPVFSEFFLLLLISTTDVVNGTIG